MTASPYEQSCRTMRKHSWSESSGNTVNCALDHALIPDLSQLKFEAAHHQGTEKRAAQGVRPAPPTPPGATRCLERTALGGRFGKPCAVRSISDAVLIERPTDTRQYGGFGKSLGEFPYAVRGRCLRAGLRGPSQDGASLVSGETTASPRQSKAE